MPLLTPPPLLGRRAALGAALLGAAAGAAPPLSRVALARGPLLPTPAQTSGPFYPLDWEAGDADADLVRVTGTDARALGTVAHLRGRVLDARTGSPVPGAVLEVWQCDARGVYRHPRDPRSALGRDAGFQGRGRAVAGPDGAYAFRTIRPVAYPGRTPHIHLAAWRPGERGPALVTQVYVEGEPLNERDFLLRAIRDPREREALMARFVPADGVEPGALLAPFDVVLA